MKLFLLNIRKGQVESVNQDRKHNDQKQKRQKEKNTHKTKIEQQDLH